MALIRQGHYRLIRKVLMMKMTRQHFNMIATVLRETEMSTTVRARLAQRFGYELAKTNGAFDLDRFVQAVTTQE